MVAGRSKKALASWLAQRDDAWRAGVEVVAMDGFTGYKSATTQALGEQTRVVTDPFHVVKLAGQALDETRRRIQHSLTARRATTKDALYRARRTLLTGADLLTDRQQARLDALFADQRHTAVEVTWVVYQRVRTAYHHEDRAEGKRQMRQLIDSIAKGVPAGISEVARLGRTLARRRDDVLAYFDIPGSSNGPTEAVNGRLEHLRGIAQGFRNLTHYIARSLIHSGGLRHTLT